MKKHLAGIHAQSASQLPYSRTARYWRQLEQPEVQDWVADAAADLFDAPDSKATRKQTCGGHLVIVTVVRETLAQRIMDLFSPAGYVDELAKYGALDAIQSGTSVAAWLFGGQPGSRVVHFTWFPPGDGQPYCIVVAQDILTARERTDFGV